MKITARIDSLSWWRNNTIKVNFEHSDELVEKTMPKIKNWNRSDRRQIISYFPDTPKRGSYYVTYEICDPQQANIDGLCATVCWIPVHLRGDALLKRIHFKRTVKPITLLERIAMYFKKPLQST